MEKKYLIKMNLTAKIRKIYMEQDHKFTKLRLSYKAKNSVNYLKVRIIKMKKN